jgi:hypothetical protein
VGHSTGMILRSTISSWIKAIALTAFAFALVFFPPSASHAASGMHADHHVVAVASDHGVIGHDHGDMAPIDAHTKHGAPTTDDKGDASTGNCCNGICLSVVLLENTVTQRDVTVIGTYRIPNAQARSLVAHGFLRPPQFLI